MIVFERLASPRLARVCHVFGAFCTPCRSWRDDFITKTAVIARPSARARMFDASAALIRHRQAGDGPIASDRRAQTKGLNSPVVLQANLAACGKHRARKSRVSLQSDLYQYLYQFMSGPFSTLHTLDGSALQTSGPCWPQKSGHILAEHPQRRREFIARARRAFGQPIADSTQGGAEAVTARK